MLVEERLDLLLVDIAHLLGRHGDHVAVLVAPLARELVDVGLVGEVEVEDSELLEVFGTDIATGIVEFALVALEWGKVRLDQLLSSANFVLGLRWVGCWSLDGWMEGGLHGITYSLVIVPESSHLGGGMMVFVAV